MDGMGLLFMKPKRGGLLDMPKPEGLLRPGNIDLNARPVVNNKDGSISTIESMSVNMNGVDWLIPTIRDGVRMSEEDAVQHFLKTGQHLGAFANSELATAYAKALSLRQGKQYGGDK